MRARSTSKMKRHWDWLAQALRDLRHAETSLGAGDYEWACFAAQQAAEKAVKALYEYLGGEGWGHTVSKLLKELPDEFRPSRELIKDAADLDKLYIPTRYPNGFEEGYPGEFFHEENAKEAINKAKRIIEYVEEKISGS